MTSALHRIRDAGLPLAAWLARRPAGGDRRRMLVIQPDHLGDILLSQPAVRLLREQLPRHELIAVVGPWSEEITRMAWPVDQVLTVDFPGFTREPGARPWEPYALLGPESARLRDLRAGSAVVLRPDAWWAAWLARSSVSGPVYGLDHPRARPFLTHGTDSSSDHRASLAVAVARLATGGRRNADAWDMSPSLAVPSQAIERVRQLRDRFGIAAQYIVVHPGAGARVKLWPAQRWRALIDSLDGWQIVLTGTPDERRMCAAIAVGYARTVNLAGETDLVTLAGILRGAALAAGTDNGAMHLAGALGTPTVRLFGPSDSAIYGPLPDSPKQRVLSAGWRCPRCGDLGPDRKAGCGCMLALTVEQVQAAIADLLRPVDAP